MSISIIVAIAENNAIGMNNNLLCHIPKDMKFFKEKTTGHKIIMGKRTYASLPFRPLPNRTSIVITDDPAETFEGCITVYSIEEAVAACGPDEECFVIGGGMVYRQMMDHADTLYITHVHKAFEGDVFFPEIDPAVWEESSCERDQSDDKNDFTYSFVTYKRRD